jgi:carbonyl reductase 1
MVSEAGRPSVACEPKACCPGWSFPWFDDMSAAQPPDQAATDVLWLATVPPGTRQPYGELVQHRKILPFMPTA